MTSGRGRAGTPCSQARLSGFRLRTSSYRSIAEGDGSENLASRDLKESIRATVRIDEAPYELVAERYQARQLTLGGS